MAGLAQSNLNILEYYAQSGNRERYWNYLQSIDGNDHYGLLALGVVRNNNMPGATANTYAQSYVKAHPVNGKTHLSESEWQKVGVDLVRADFEQRKAQFFSGHADLALNLPVENVYFSHKIAFEKNHISQQAWTPAALLDASYRKTNNFEEGNKIWDYMLNSSYSGSVRVYKTIYDNFHLSNHVRAGYLGDTSLAYANAINTLPHIDPNKTGRTDNYFQFHNESWTHHKRVALGRGMVWHSESVKDASVLNELNDARATRIYKQSFTEERYRHPQDPTSIRKSIHTIAETDTNQINELGLKPNSDSKNRLLNLLTASQSGDENAFRAARSEIFESPQGQNILAKASSTVDTQEQQLLLGKQAVLEKQNQAQLLEQQNAPVIRGPVM